MHLAPKSNDSWTPARSETSTIIEVAKLTSVVIDGWVKRSELIDWTTFSCSLTEHAHAIAVEVNLLLGQPFPVH